MGIKTNKDELFKLYKETIKQPMFDDLVLIVLGGEKGVIAEYFEKNIKFSKLIVIEPLTALGNDPQTKNNYRNFNIRNKGKILHFTLKEIEKEPNKFIDLLLKNEIIEKGMEVIRNPFYEEHYSEVIMKVHEQFNRIVDHIRSVITMNINAETFERLQKKHDLISFNTGFEKETKQEISKVKSGKLLVLIGFENGYFFKELLKAKDVFNIAIIEPLNLSFNKNQIDILKEIRQLSNQTYDSFEFDKGDIEYLRFFDYISKYSMYLNDIEILINPEYIRKHYEDTLKTVRKVKEIVIDIGSLKGNSNADDIYGLMNALYNLRYVDKLKVIPKDLTFKNVITVAAGPSLDNHMEELKTLSKKFIVVAVEVVVDKLLKNGIFPDIVCTQERILTVYTNYTSKFDKEIKEKTVYVAPAILHTYSLEEMQNTVLAPQALRSSYQRYIYDAYYSFSTFTQTSIHAGLFAINVALLFRPENILIFGHDVSVPINKQSHAEDVKANDYYRKNSEIIVGNRGQKLYSPPLLKKFYDNTELMTKKFKQEIEINFYNFSDGAKISTFEDSNESIYKSFLEEKSEKIELTEQLVSTNSKLKESTLKQLYDEKSILEHQLQFLSKMSEMTRFTKNVKFLSEIAEKDSLLAKALRLLLDEYYANHSIFKDNIENWLAENTEEIFNTATFMLEIVNNTIDVLEGKAQLPLYDSKDLEKLYHFKLFAVIRNKFIDDDYNPKKELSEYEFIYLIESFLHTFQPLNYLHFFNLLVLFKSKYVVNERNKELYHRGITRCIDFFQTKLKEIKNEKDERANKFLTGNLVSLLYEGERYEELIELINQQNNASLFELDLLADSYNEIGKYDSSFFIYKEFIKNNKQNKKTVLNLFNNLVFMDKYAESIYLSNIIHTDLKAEPVYNANYNYLKEQITVFKGNQDSFDLIYSEVEPSDLSYIKITNKKVLTDVDNIVELLGKQQNIQFTKFEDRFYFDKKPDLTYFIEDIIIH